MLPAQPPNSRRMLGTRKATLILCSWSASSASEKRPSKAMMVSKASEPQMRAVMGCPFNEVDKVSWVENIDAEAGGPGLGQVEHQPRRLLGIRGETVVRVLAGRQVVARRNDAARYRRFI